jgi:hypothetical protein
MRILRLIISAFLFFAVVIVGGFFILRAIMLYRGSYKISSSLRELTVAKNRGSYGSQCALLGSNAIAGELPVTYQLRFISSSEYLTEAVCDGFRYDPILINQGKLPQFITKVPGKSGFLLNLENTGIEIEVFALEIENISKATGFDFSSLSKINSLVAQNGVLIKDVVIDITNDGPITMCSGYGYECCNEVSHFGTGDKIIGLNDCEQSCYAQCSTRPVLLSFNTFPLLDPKTRSITVTSGSPVEFTYVADSGNADSMSGVLDFGDGDKAPISGLAGQVSHTYECTRSRCEYSVLLSLEDNWGVKSANLQTNKLKIIVTR